MSADEKVIIKKSEEPVIIPADLQAIMDGQVKPVLIEEEPQEENTFLDLLENKDMLVNGIILSEVLGKPKSKR